MINPYKAAVAKAVFLESGGAVAVMFFLLVNTQRGGDGDTAADGQAVGGLFAQRVS